MYNFEDIRYSIVLYMKLFADFVHYDYKKEKSRE